MSRSRKHTPMTPWCRVDSGVEDKQRANRNFRHAVKIALRGNPVSAVLPLQEEVFSDWFSYRDCDGWFYFDPKEYPYLMRK